MPKSDHLLLTGIRGAGSYRPKHSIAKAHINRKSGIRHLIEPTVVSSFKVVSTPFAQKDNVGRGCIPLRSPQLSSQSRLIASSISQSRAFISQVNQKLARTHANTKGYMAFATAVLSGLGLWVVSQHPDLLEDFDFESIFECDDYDEDDELEKRYNLNYQLNSRVYDAATDNDVPIHAFQGDRLALSQYLISDTVPKNNAQRAIHQFEIAPLPKARDYGLWAVGLADQRCQPTLPAHSLVNLNTVNFLNTVGIISVTKSSGVLPSSTMIRNSHLSLVDHTALAERIKKQHLNYQADCRRIQRINFEKTLSNAMIIYQHKCFMEKIPWREAMPIVRDHICKTLLKTDPYAIENPILAHAKMYAQLKKVNYSVHSEGGRFKAHKKTNTPLANHTQILSASGTIYALLNELTESDSQALLEQFGMEKSGKLILGEGNFGKVRLALNLETGKIVAVKKMFSRYMANLEIEEFQGIPDDDHLVSLYDYAHVRTSDGDNKSYLFMELVGDVNGDALVKALAVRRQKKSWLNGEKKLLLQAVLECCVAVVKLHELGIYHCDIKPENFFISHKSIHLGDYGLASRDKASHPGSTLAYNPLDRVYDAEKHDAYALGITFYEFMHGAHPEALNDTPKTSHTDRLPGLTLSECVDKLREQDPDLRITAREFIQLPYIQKLMSRKQRSAVRDLIIGSDQTSEK